MQDTNYIAVEPTLAGDCPFRAVSAARLSPDAAYRDAIEALIYAIEHPGSNQKFAVEAGRQALALEPAADKLAELRAAVDASKRTLAQLRCSFSRNSVGYSDASETIFQCQRALEQQ